MPHTMRLEDAENLRSDFSNEVIQAGYTGISVAGGPYSDWSLAGGTDRTETQATGGEVRIYRLSAVIKVSLSQQIVMPSLLLQFTAFTPT